MDAVTSCSNLEARENKICCCFHFFPIYLIWSNGLEEAQAGIKVARRNTNNLRYADDTALVAESKEEPKSLLIKVKEENEKAGLKLKI